MKKIAWFSCGATSAVACKLALNSDPTVEIVYIDTGSGHPDNKRFIKECESWYGKKITIIKSEKFSNVFDVIKKTRFVNSPYGASCTRELKIAVRLKYEKENNINSYYWGFESGKKEENRAERLSLRYPKFKHHFPLIELHVNKTDCLDTLKELGIEYPTMYKLGYNNNNCIGCPKGGMKYWNKIRKDFPEVFNRMAKLEREVGHTCIKNIYLDKLDPSRGYIKKILPLA
jgi:3'-phosphoadenosine 5'-phosphosulfate sulfotransferase (PAPS reductase)/FAD synthetase